jgi:DNA modification methylase
MISSIETICKHPVHPFPARMAPTIVWDSLRKYGRKQLTILDPMAGSGTTLVVARSKGHIAYGVDRDPLAVIIARTWCGDVNKEKLLSKALEVLERAQKTAKVLTSKSAYPCCADDETKDFVRYWFDLRNRKQLAGLSKHISLVRDQNLRSFLWTAFSRMIITKKYGVSLAMDVSHSRPHRVCNRAPVTAFEIFMKTVERVVKGNPFSSVKHIRPKARIAYGDSKKLNYKDNFFDLVITSPPYLNAIDYLRGHRLSLVWMKNSIGKLRKLRATNIGAESKGLAPKESHIMNALVDAGNMERLPSRERGFLVRYALDMDSVCCEIARVIKPGGNAIFVTGDSTLKGIFIKNSQLIRRLSEYHGLEVEAIEERILPEKHRYLPPPSNTGAGKQLRMRMHKEVILTMRKTS